MAGVDLGEEDGGVEEKEEEGEVEEKGGKEEEEKTTCDGGDADEADSGLGAPEW